MKKIYSSFLLSSLLVCMSTACDDGSLDHDDVYIPDPVEESDEDDGYSMDPTATAVIKLKLGEENKHQEIDGFGCAFCGWAHRIWNTMERDKVMDDLFGDDGLKLNIYRGEIYPSYQNPDGSINFGMERDFNRAPNDPYYIDNYWRIYNGEECGEQMQLGQMWTIDYIHNKLKKNDVHYFFSIWSPPGTWKEGYSGNALYGGQLSSTYYQDYADYMVDFMDAYEQKLGIDIYGISGWNEPDHAMGGWAGCNWSEDQMSAVTLDYLRPELDRRGYNDVKVVYGENAWWRNARKFSNNSISKRPELAQANTIIAGHGYSTADSDIVPIEKAEENNLQVWQTEICDDKGRDETWTDAMKWARIYHQYLVNANVNAIVWWAGARPCSTTGENLIQLEEALPSSTYYRVERYYSVGQFTRYIERGAHRVDVEKISSEDTKLSEKNLLVSAYVKDDRYTIVIVNYSQKKSISTLLEVEGMDFQNMVSYTSTADMKWYRKKLNPSMDGKRAVDIPKFSVVTITGKLKANTAE